jgi:hypothetical protein
MGTAGLAFEVTMSDARTTRGGTDTVTAEKGGAATAVVPVSGRCC